jgi:uncharacterized protein involved in tolerance to divalent cations
MSLSQLGNHTLEAILAQADYTVHWLHFATSAAAIYRRIRKQVRGAAITCYAYRAWKSVYTWQRQIRRENEGEALGIGSQDCCGQCLQELNLQGLCYQCNCS